MNKINKNQPDFVVKIIKHTQILEIYGKFFGENIQTLQQKYCVIV